MDKEKMLMTEETIKIKTLISEIDFEMEKDRK
jgi:hypothetical protein